jgi:hypothetical protein
VHADKAVTVVAALGRPAQDQTLFWHARPFVFNREHAVSVGESEIGIVITGVSHQLRDRALARPTADVLGTDRISEALTVCARIHSGLTLGARAWTTAN